ncbi:LON peptidase substrate-binding domain-containing protein [Emticicia sp. 17c]|uniref:LON peptidase substrate-binding domain-containing protein n=1 Tax=Emticicia sp. 17c TaxID=3127704 RepID=UPI00301DCF73
MSFLSLFPLNLVVFPHEDLNLHIFEPRYKELINECLENQTTFGIPTFVNNKLAGYGTEVHITQLSKRYGDGRMDIKTKGLRIFRITDFQNPVPDKLYAGGEVVFIENEDLNETINPILLSLVNRLYALLKIKVDYNRPEYQPFSYRIAHKIGLSVSEEYELLTVASEAQRQQVLVTHLKRILPIVSEVERAKELIAMNGHFKGFDALNF